MSGIAGPILTVAVKINKSKVNFDEHTVWSKLLTIALIHINCGHFPIQVALFKFKGHEFTVTSKSATTKLNS